jgi:hypothetical protein
MADSTIPADPLADAPPLVEGGRRKRSNGSRKNSWLSHVKATMKVNRNKSFKQVLKLAKKTYKKSQSRSQSKSSSQSAGKRRPNKRGGSNPIDALLQKQQGGSSNNQADALLQKQQGGSGMAGKPTFGESAAPVA